jgi:hypothetical protein
VLLAPQAEGNVTLNNKTRVDFTTLDDATLLQKAGEWQQCRINRAMDSWHLYELVATDDTKIAVKSPRGNEQTKRYIFTADITTGECDCQDHEYYCLPINQEIERRHLEAVPLRCKHHFIGAALVSARNQQKEREIRAQEIAAASAIAQAKQTAPREIRYRGINKTVTPKIAHWQMRRATPQQMMRAA